MQGDPLQGKTISFYLAGPSPFHLHGDHKTRLHATFRKHRPIRSQRTGGKEAAHHSHRPAFPPSHGLPPRSQPETCRRRDPQTRLPGGRYRTHFRQADGKGISSSLPGREPPPQGSRIRRPFQALPSLARQPSQQRQGPGQKSQSPERPRQRQRPLCKSRRFPAPGHQQGRRPRFCPSHAGQPPGSTEQKSQRPKGAKGQSPPKGHRPRQGTSRGSGRRREKERTTQTPQSSTPQPAAR